MLATQSSSQVALPLAANCSSDSATEGANRTALVCAGGLGGLAVTVPGGTDGGIVGATVWGAIAGLLVLLLILLLLLLLLRRRQRRRIKYAPPMSSPATGTTAADQSITKDLFSPPERGGATADVVKDLGNIDPAQWAASPLLYLHGAEHAACEPTPSIVPQACTSGETQAYASEQPLTCDEGTASTRSASSAAAVDEHPGPLAAIAESDTFSPRQTTRIIPTYNLEEASSMAAFSTAQLTLEKRLNLSRRRNAAAVAATAGVLARPRISPAASGPTSSATPRPGLQSSAANATPAGSPSPAPEQLSAGGKRATLPVLLGTRSRHVYKSPEPRTGRPQYVSPVSARLDLAATADATCVTAESTQSAASPQGGAHLSRTASGALSVLSPPPPLQRQLSKEFPNKVTTVAAPLLRPHPRPRPLVSPSVPAHPSVASVRSPDSSRIWRPTGPTETASAEAETASRLPGWSGRRQQLLRSLRRAAVTVTDARANASAGGVIRVLRDFDSSVPGSILPTH